MRIIYTIGYEGTDIQRFVETLQAVGVEAVADVRAVPISRKKGFSKKSLTEHLQAAGIGYQHFVELGDPKDGRDAAREKRFADFRNIYGAHIAQRVPQEAVGHLAELARFKTVAMLCFERDPKTCHRTIVAEQLGCYGFKPFDLYGDDPSRYERHADRLPSHDPDQSTTAAE